MWQSSVHIRWKTVSFPSLEVFKRAEVGGPLREDGNKGALQQVEKVI